MIAMNKRTHISSTGPMELHLHDRAAPVQVIWTRTEDGRQLLGLERLPEHNVQMKSKGGLLLIAMAVALSFLAGHVIKNDDGIRHLLMKHRVSRSNK